MYAKKGTELFQIFPYPPASPPLHGRNLKYGCTPAEDYRNSYAPLSAMTITLEEVGVNSCVLWESDSAPMREGELRRIGATRARVTPYMLHESHREMGASSG